MSHLLGAMLIVGMWLQAGARLPEGPAGRLMAAYLEAFNAPGEEAIKQFFAKHVSEEERARVPIETRLARFREMRERLGRLELVKTIASSDSSITAHLRSSNGPNLEFTLELASTSPPMLRGIRVEDREEGESDGVEPKANDEEWVAAVGTYLDQAAARDEFSGAVLLARGDKVVLEKAYGLADKTSKAPNRADTRFNLGSINKIFTNIAIHQLAAQGKLSLDDKISRFLPDYPNRDAAAKVTVKHLLSMTSGIGDFFGERYEQAQKEKVKSISAYLPLFADKPLEFEPGTRSRYSNGGYIVLGAIIEKASGMDYYSYVKKNIYLPAGMSQSDWYEKDHLPPNMAIGYKYQDRPMVRPGDERRPNYESLPGKGSSAGGGYSTLRDLLSFVQALKQQKVFTPDFHADGLGIAGGAPGMNAILDSGRDYVIVVLANYDPPTAEKVARQIRGWRPR